MADEKPLPATAAVTEEDLRVSRAGPAIYSNRVIVNLEAVVRLSFLEQTKEGSQFRTAVALPHQTAIEMANMLKRVLAEVEADLERFRTEAEAAEAAEAAKKNG